MGAGMSMTREDLQDTARKAFGNGPLMPDASASWAQLAEMGWFMMTVPEARGGLGLGGEAVAAIHTELGRALVPGSAIAQMMVLEALCGANATPERDALLKAAMTGERMTASLELPSAALTCVPDADLASRVLVLGSDRVALSTMAAITHRPTWDESRRLFDVTPDDGLVLAEGPAAQALTDKVQARLLLALAADSLGGAEATLDMTVDYLKTRRQFDRPLALFQALKHRVADMKIRVAGSQALLWSLASTAISPVSAGAIKAHCAASYRFVVEEAVQLHGGIGLTVEHPCHRFLKRAFLNSALAGDSDAWEEQVGRQALG